MTAARVSCLLLAFGTAAGIAAVDARPSRAADGDKRTAARSDRLGSLSQRFATEDQSELLLLLDELPQASDGDPHQAARAVASLLAAGQSDSVTDHALSSLGRLGVREGREALLLYARHRRPETRERAYAALAQLRVPEDIPSIAEGLRDSAAQVRATAARALGDLHATSSVPDLLRALGRGVTEASPALGKVGDAASVDQFAVYLGKQPLDVMLAGYANYLDRSDLAEPVKLHIVAVLEDVSGGAVKRFLAEWVAKHKPRSQKLQQAIMTTIARIKVEPQTPARQESRP